MKRYETIKSLILIGLIITSIVLYYNLWTYQPSYAKLKNKTTVEQELISQKKEISAVVKPVEIIQHVDGKHYGTIATTDINSVTDSLKLWDYHEFEDISLEINNFLDFVHQDNSMEIVFPTELPVELYRNILKLTSKSNTNFDFDRILIPLDTSKNKKGVVYFISLENKEVYKTTTDHSFLERFYAYKESINTSQSLYEEYMEYQPTENRIIYLPANKIKMEKYKYWSKTIDEVTLKNALFSDPSLAQKNFLATGEEYTDNMSLLRINTESHIVTFLKPSEDVPKSTDQDQLIKKSFAFVNEHGGWTDQYRYIGISKDKQQVNFRLYDKVGYPIFNEENPISQIQLVWGSNEVNRYVRSNLIAIQTNIDSSIATLKSGKSVTNYLKKQVNLNPDLMEDIVVGYKLTVDTQNIMYLQPAWYYQYNGDWYEVYSNGAGGNLDGLE